MGRQVTQITVRDVVVDYEVLREKLARVAVKVKALGLLDSDREPEVAFCLNALRCVEGEKGQEKTDLELIRFGEPLSNQEARRRLTEMGISLSEYPDALSLRGRHGELAQQEVRWVAVVGVKSVPAGQKVAIYLVVEDSRLNAANHEVKRPWGKDTWFLGRRSSNPGRRTTITEAKAGEK